MKRFLLSSLLCLALYPVTGQATDAIYINWGSTNNPQIDATTFVNFGTFTATGVLPFETFSTLNYTNSGVMQGAPGWRFQYNPLDSSSRGMAANFVNQNPGYIYAQDLLNPAPFPLGDSILLPSYLLVSATNIVTGGGTFASGASLSVGAMGRMELFGHDVDVSRSGLEVRPLGESAVGDVLIFVDDVPVEFQPDVGVYDLYWAQDSFFRRYPLNSAGLWDGLFAQAPSVPSPPGFPDGFARPTPAPPLFLPIPFADSYINFEDVGSVTVTNAQGAEVEVVILTNIFKGAVFVSVPNEQFGVQLGFSGGFEGPQLAEALIDMYFTNAVTGAIGTNRLVLWDTLASSTNRGTARNLVGTPPESRRPVNYFIDRRVGFGIGPAGNNGYPQEDFLLSSGIGFINEVPDEENVVLSDAVTNAVREVGDFAAYGAFVDNLAARPRPVPGANLTEAPGRIHIKANNLDLTETRIRGEGLLQIEATNLISSSGLVVDCENLSFNLTSTNGALNLQYLAQDQVTRLRGDLYMWSAFWSNTVELVIDNWIFSETNDPVQTNITIFLNVGYHAFMVDASRLVTTVPVSVNDLTTHSTHTTISDNVSVVEKLQINSDSFTLTGNLLISGQSPFDSVSLYVFPTVVPLQNWTAANAPSLRHFTNYGSLSIANDALFGSDRATPYSSFVNTGQVTAASFNLRASYFEPGGIIQASGPMSVNVDVGRFTGGVLSAGGAMQLKARDLKLDNCQLNAGNGLQLNVSGSLSDGGETGNLIQTGNGFRLQRLPASGDLLATTINSVVNPTPSATVLHAWAGEDRGAVAAGYLNNAALGVLRLTRSSGNPRFMFSSVAAQNALYVDLLDVTSLTDLTNQLVINPGMKLYYAAVSAAFVPPPWPDTGQPRSVEEYLDGAFGGRLRWVNTYAGLNSSEVVLIAGQPTLVNRALRNSTIIDSDEDGIPNAADTDPFATVPADPVAPPAAYTPVAATYNGLFFTVGGVEVDNSGAVTITTTASGSFTARLRQAGKQFSFKGQLSATGGSTNVVPRSGTTSLTVVLQVNTPENTLIAGTVTDGNWVAGLHADRAAFNARSNPAPLAGRYTVALPGPGSLNDPLLPAGHGFGTVTVNTAGRVNFSGQLADGTRVTQSTTMAADGHWPVFVPLYRNAGLLLGWFRFWNGVAEDVTGMAAWVKPANAGDQYYPGGFNEPMSITGSLFNPALSPVTAFVSGRVALSGGNLSSVLAQNVDVAANNRATVTGGGKLTITSKTGLIKGSLVDPATGRPVRFQGAILQRQGEAVGFFLGTSQSGDVSLQPR